MKKIVSLILIMVFVLNSIPIQTHAATGVDLTIGKYIEFGQYNGVDILWRIIQDDDVNNRIMLVSDKIITLRPFDASQTGHITFGNNIWSESNLRDWLNSSTTPELRDDEWTHQKPTNANHNDYIHEPGFLSNFTTAERSIIMKTDDDSNKSISGNNITLLTEAQLPLLTIAGYADYIASITPEAIEESKDDSRGTPSYDPGGTIAKPWRYWTRTPRPLNTYSIRHVNSVGSVTHLYGAYDGYNGIRPVLWIDTNNLVLSNNTGMDENNAYTVSIPLGALEHAGNGTNSDRSNFKYYLGLDYRGIVKCMLVADDPKSSVISKNNILDSEYKFIPGIYYINKKGVIKQYNP